MNEHERTVRAAQQVDKMVGFYVHLTVFLLVCVSLAAVNWLATPEVLWAVWPFLGWGVAVVFHALCAFGRGPNAVAEWRLRKIRALTEPEHGADRPTNGARSSAVTAVVSFLLGILLGAAAGGGYGYTLLADARRNAQAVEASRAALEATGKEQEGKLKQVTAEKGSLESELSETKNRLTQAQSAKEAAERALAEAKKGSSQ